MAATFGRLEYQITVPTGGWDTTVGGVTKTIPAGTYYLSSVGSGSRDFLAEVAFQFGASSVAGSLGENGTGLITIQFSGATAIAWVDTEVRDILGFTGDSASATSHTGTKHARGAWLPQTPPLRLNAGGNWRGHMESDYRSVSNMAGYVWVRAGQSRTILEPLAWDGLKQHKIWIGSETDSGYANQSLQRFWLDGVWGQAAWGTPGGPVRYYENAALDTNYGTYRVLDSADFRPEPRQEGWVGFWRWRMPKLVMVPGSDSEGLGGTSRATISWVLREAASSTTAASSYTTGSFTPNADRLQVLDVLTSSTGSAEVPTSVVGCGLTWVSVGSISFVSGNRMLSRWRAMGPAPSTGSLTISFLSSHSSCLWNWKEVTNADTSGTDGSGAFVQTTTNSAGAGSTTINGTLAALEHANNSHIAAVGLNVGTGVTPDAQFTELGDDAEVTPDSSLEAQWAANETVCTATFASSSAGILSSEIKAATT